VTSPRLLVIQHNLDDSLNELGAPLSAAGLYMDVWDTRLLDEPPHPVAHYDGVLSLGGLNSASDEAGRPAVTAERELLAQALERGTPILGICFGAQLLARAAGGRSFRANRAEIGWCTVDLEPAAETDRLLGGLPNNLHVFQYHYDTFELPANATVLGRNRELVQTYRIGQNAWGLQFHVEANPGQVYGWLGTYGHEMQNAGVDLDNLRAFTARYAPRYREITWEIGSGFAGIVAEQHALTSSDADKVDAPSR
jgi:GMP synthase (glutamine-hydrolysing)